MDRQRFESALFQHFARRTPLAVIEHFALADKRQRDVGQLDEVAAGTYAAVLGIERQDVAVDKLLKQLHRLTVDAGVALRKLAQTRKKRRFHISWRQRFARTGGMAADDVVLQVMKVLVIDTPLSHWTEAGVDPVNHFALAELLEERVTAVNPAPCFGIQLNALALQQDLGRLFQS